MKIVMISSLIQLRKGQLDCGVVGTDEEHRGLAQALPAFRPGLNQFIVFLPPGPTRAEVIRIMFANLVI